MNFQVRKAWDLERLEPNDFFPVPSSVVFARADRGEEGKARALAGDGAPVGWGDGVGECSKRVDMEITDTSRGDLCRRMRKPVAARGDDCSSGAFLCERGTESNDSAGSAVLMTTEVHGAVQTTNRTLERV